MRKQNLSGAPSRVFGVIAQFVPIRIKPGYVQNRVMRVKLSLTTSLDDLDNLKEEVMNSSPFRCPKRLKMDEFSSTFCASPVRQVKKFKIFRYIYKYPVCISRHIVHVRLGQQVSIKELLRTKYGILWSPNGATELVYKGFQLWLLVQLFIRR